jgi:hypothetical protein
MLGCYDFCAHYEWTFQWLDQTGGETAVIDYWDECISKDSQQHASKLIGEKGFAGMGEYWGHVLEEEAAGYVVTEGENVFRIDMMACPSKGFLIRNGLKQYRDYCDHCMGWVGPMLQRNGYTTYHQHNHHGQCWWEIRKKTDPNSPSGPAELSGTNDVRVRPDWKGGDEPLHQFEHDMGSRKSLPSP